MTYRTRTPTNLPFATHFCFKHFCFTSHLHRLTASRGINFYLFYVIVLFYTDLKPGAHTSVISVPCLGNYGLPCRTTNGTTQCIFCHQPPQGPPRPIQQTLSLSCEEGVIDIQRATLFHVERCPNLWGNQTVLERLDCKRHIPFLG